MTEKRWDILHGDSRCVLADMEPDSIDSVVTDPPYALVSISKRFGKDGAAECQFGTDGAYRRASAGFMGKAWDTGETAFDPAFWALVLRVMKPGAFLLAFGGTRSYHRLVCAIEDAGFEIRDTVTWHHGTGFPKSKNIGNGMGTALKPATELICLARKPLSEKSVAENWAKWGTGALNIDAGRIPTSDTWQATGTQSAVETALCGGTDGSLNVSVSSAHDLGRWPANAIFSEEAAADLDRQSGLSTAGQPRDERGTGGIWDAGTGVPCGPQYGDIGGASRFFYVPKPDRAERDAGCEGMEKQARSTQGRDVVQEIDRKDGRGRVPVNAQIQPAANTHPTLKPVSLMEYLVTLVTPPGGLVLDPFCGSGTTGMAALNKGFRFVGIEREAEYHDIACRRLAHSAGETGLFE